MLSKVTWWLTQRKDRKKLISGDNWRRNQQQENQPSSKVRLQSKVCRSRTISSNYKKGHKVRSRSEWNHLWWVRRSRANLVNPIRKVSSLRRIIELLKSPKYFLNWDLRKIYKPKTLLMIIRSSLNSSKASIWSSNRKTSKICLRISI